MTPHFSKNQVVDAGALLRSGTATDSEKSHADEVTNYWRRIHLEPLQRMMQVSYSCLDDDSTPVAGRIKKYDTIVDKLRRYSTTKLPTMYDIAGCRIVVNDLCTLEQLCYRLTSVPEYDEEKSSKKNYLRIPHPSQSGYRGRHLIFAFDDLECKHKLFVELQVRTKLQHLWSTAVELYDKAAKTRLKFGEKNPTSWQFFRRASELIRCLENNEAIVPERIREAFPISEASSAALGTLNVLKEASESSSVLATFFDDFEYCLVDFLSSEQSIMIFETDEEHAIDDYFKHENALFFGETVESAVDHDTVLVRGHSLDQLAVLYPNYFGDISEFINLINKYLNVFY